jgi:hypothetical protein
MFASALHAVGVAAIAGMVVAPGAAAPSAVAEFNTGVAWFGSSTASVAPANSVLLTAAYSVTGAPPPDAVLGFTLSYPVGVTVESPGHTCTVDGTTRTVVCGSSAEGTSPQLRVSVAAGATPGTTLQLTARVNPVPGDADPADDEATATVTVVPIQARVTVDGPAAVAEGETWAMQVVLFNDGDTDRPAGFRGQVSMNLPAGGEDLFTWVSLPPGCATDPLSFVCDPSGSVPAGGSRSFEFRLKSLPGAAGRVFTLAARYDPAEGTTVRDSADVRITAARVASGPAEPAGPVPADLAPETVDGADPAAGLPATGVAVLPMTALGLGLTALGVWFMRSRRMLGRR